MGIDVTQDDAGAPAAGLARWSVPIVWLISAAGTAVVVGLAWSGTRVWFHDSGPYAALGVLGMVFAASVIAALLLQLASRRPQGYVGRASASIAGAVVPVAVGALALLPVLG
ncbi:hypothetical protein [Agromyces sp. GXQ0307]|uniref:hypothetical protein n=1 Tax=Agromyces sp. GXQ0307 TaxID=3377835 RepID=UPI00383ADAC4